MARAMSRDHGPVTVRTWVPDPSHYPEQLTPLSATVWFAAIGHGLHEAMRQLQAPFGGFHARTEGGWAYEGELEPDWDVDTERFDSAARNLQRRWDAELRPRVHEITEELHGLRPEAPDAPGAVAMLRRMQHLVREQWTIHFLAVIPAQIAVEMFEQEYRRQVGDEDPFQLYRLLDEVDNETNRADALLWELAERARTLHVDDVIREFPPAAAMDRLRLTAHGRQLLHELDAYLLRFGGRSRWHELSLPREVEEPWMTFQSLRLLLDSGHGPTRGGRSRDSDVLLRSHPELEEPLRTAQFAYALKEGHVHHIDYPGLLATREVLRGIGRRLRAAGILEHVDDVWMLRFEELERVLLDPASVDIAGVIVERRQELETGRREGPRPYLGDAPTDTERHAALTKFYGAPTSGSSDGVLRGTAASPGVAEGPARIVRSTDDFSRISPGDVLVVATTTPAWTPLFPSVAALVTETGGVLCHGAIVAREYEIPSVVGVEAAMDRIPDGELVRVDGGAGEIELLSGPKRLGEPVGVPREAARAHPPTDERPVGRLTRSAREMSRDEFWSYVAPGDEAGSDVSFPTEE